MSFPNLYFFNKPSEGQVPSYVEGRVKKVELYPSFCMLTLDFGFGDDVVLKSFERRVVGDLAVVSAGILVRKRLTVYDLKWLGEVRPFNSKFKKLGSFEVNSEFKTYNHLFIHIHPKFVTTESVRFKKFQLAPRFKSFLAVNGLIKFFVPLGGLRLHQSRGGGFSLIWHIIDVFESWLVTKNQFLVRINSTKYDSQASQYYYYKSIKLTLYYKYLLNSLKYMYLKDVPFVRSYLILRTDLYYKSVLELRTLVGLDSLQKNKTFIQRLKFRKFDLGLYYFFLLNNIRVYSKQKCSMLFWFLLSTGSTVITMTKTRPECSFDCYELAKSDRINPRLKSYFLPVLVNKRFSMY